VVDAFPRPVWVRGEIQQLTKSRNGHTYFELVEKADSRDRVRAVLRIVLFRDARAAVNRMLREVPRSVSRGASTSTRRLVVSSS